MTRPLKHTQKQRSGGTVRTNSRPSKLFSRTYLSAIVGVIIFAAVGVYALASSHAATLPDYTSGQVVHYNFQNISGATVPDISGNGNVGTLYNFPTPALTEPGSNGSRTALMFDRSLQQRVGVGTVNHTSPATSLQVSKFTISSWIKITEDDTTQQNWEVAEKAQSYWFNVRNGNDSTTNHADSNDPHYILRCGGMFAGGHFIYLNGKTVIPHGVGNTTWSHVVCTYNGSVMKIYLNGVLDASMIINKTVDHNTGALVVGGNDKTAWAPDYFHNWWQGSLDDFRLYNRALTATQVQALFQATGPQVSTPTVAQ